MLRTSSGVRIGRLLPWVAAIAVFGLLCGGTSSTAMAQQKQVVRLGQSGESLVFFPLYVARDRGYFAEEGIDLKVVVLSSGPDLVAAQAGGNIDFQDTTLFHVIRQNEQGMPMVAFASVYQELGLDVVVSAAKVKELNLTDTMPIEARVRAMKGLKLGISRPGASTDLFIRKLLTDYGMKPDTDVTLTPVGDGAPLMAALEHKVIDGFVYAIPFPQAAEVRGLGKVIVSTSKGQVENLRGFQYQVLAAPQKYIEQSPDIILKLTRALAKAQKLTKEKPEEAKASVAKFFSDIEPNTLKLAMDAALFGVPEGPVLRKRSYELNEPILNVGGSGKKYTLPPFESIVNNKFAEQAAAK